jgi:hypothetical protein
VIYALYVIGSTAGLVVLAARLGVAQRELARVRAESDDDYARAAAEECSAYAHGAAMALACLLAGLAAAWYGPPRQAARPEDSGRAGAREGTAASGSGREAAG